MVPSISRMEFAVVNTTDPLTFKVALGPKIIPAGFMRKIFALLKSVVLIVPRMLDGLFPVTRPRMLEVGRAVSFRKLAMLFVGTLNSPKL